MLAPKAEDFSDAGAGYAVTRYDASGFLRLPFGLCDWLFFARLIVREARAAGADGLLCNHWKHNLGFSAWLAARRLRIPYFVIAHGAEVNRPSRRVLDRWKRRLVYRGARRVFAVSDFTAGLVAGLGVPRERIRVVGNGYDVRRVDAWRRQQGGSGPTDVPDGDPVVLTVGRLEEHKGIDAVIEAMPVVRRSVPRARYVVVGDGPDRARLESLVGRLGLGECVRFAGYVSEEEKYAWYDRCDVFVLASRPLSDGSVEGFGIVFLEANAFGKPVIAGRSGGTADAVLDGRTGLLVDPADVGALSEALARLLTDPALARKLGASGRERVVSDMSWLRQASRLAEAMRESPGGAAAR